MKFMTEEIIRNVENTTCKEICAVTSSTVRRRVGHLSPDGVWMKVWSNVSIIIISAIE